MRPDVLHSHLSGFTCSVFNMKSSANLSPKPPPVTVQLAMRKGGKTTEIKMEVKLNRKQQKRHGNKESEGVTTVSVLHFTIYLSQPDTASRHVCKDTHNAHTLHLLFSV